MSTKKLRVDVDVETSKAKSKIKRDLGSAGSDSPSGSVSTATNGAADSVKKLGEAAEATQYNMKSAAKAFSGVAVGLAASYAAKNVDNPNAKAAIEYAGSAVSGASMGAMVAGPVGAAVGGLAGILKSYFDREGERKQMSQDFELGEERYQASRRDLEKFRDLTEVRRGGGTADQLPQLRELQSNFKNSAEELVKAYREELAKANPDKDRLSALKVNIDYARNMSDKYQGAIETIEDRRKNDRGGFSGTDALQKIGGGSGEAGGRSLMTRLQENANTTLKEIAKNTQKAGATWQ